MPKTTTANVAGDLASNERRSLFDKLWESHVIKDLGDGWALLHIDRHFLHDLSGPPSLTRVQSRELRLHNPELIFATPDHAVSSAPSRADSMSSNGAQLHMKLLQKCRETGVRVFDIGEPGHGIVHVMAPELGIVLPGLSVICGDSHTCTNGGIGALAFGVGSTESTHALATQTLRLQKPRTMRIWCEGTLGSDVCAKDLSLHIIQQLGASAGNGYAIEFAGPAIHALEIEERLTLCNMAVELGARFGIVAPDNKTIEWIRGRPYAPQGEAFEAAVPYWNSLRSHPEANYDRMETIHAGSVLPMITWGVSPAHAVPIDSVIPPLASAPSSTVRDAWTAALDYMGLEAGAPIAGTPVDWIFIGSCANARISDLRVAASVVQGHHVAAGVRAWIVPGSELVKRQAEAEGLNEIFLRAGFEWRSPGCSMCAASNGDIVPSQQRTVSTTNRNFIGRQGPGAR